MVLEGGSFFVDGEGTLITTEQCLLHPNRNPDHDARADRAHPGRLPRRRRVIWLGTAIPLDRDTDGHIDGVAQIVDRGP